jgi:hypothetical protein
MTVAELIPVLQMAIGPVVLISGVGLLILSLTNRMGRVVDRGRNLAEELRAMDSPQHPRTVEQLKILSQRAGLLRFAIVFATLSVLFAALLIIALFLFAAMKIEGAWLIAGLFICALISIVVSMISFLQELNQALQAFRMDIGE